MPQLPVRSDGVDAAAVGAPQRWTFSIAGVKAWDVLSCDGARDIGGYVENVKLPFPELSAGDVRDVSAVGSPAHVDSVRRTELIDQNAAIPGCRVQENEAVEGLLGVRLPTCVIGIDNVLLIWRPRVPRRSDPFHAPDDTSGAELENRQVRKRSVRRRVGFAQRRLRRLGLAHVRL